MFNLSLYFQILYLTNTRVLLNLGLKIFVIRSLEPAELSNQEHVKTYFFPMICVLYALKKSKKKQKLVIVKNFMFFYSIYSNLNFE